MRKRPSALSDKITNFATEKGMAAPNKVKRDNNHTYTLLYIYIYTTR